MTALVFVDTNVFVYARDASEPAKSALARAWLERLWREHRGRTSVQVLSEYFVTVTAKLRPGLEPDEAWDDVQALFSWEPQAVDATLLCRGKNLAGRHRLSWWDALVLAACEAQGCRLLLSEDFGDGSVLGGVTVRSPFSLKVGEEVASYGPAGPASLSRHPPRGRPRKYRPAA